MVESCNYKSKLSIQKVYPDMAQYHSFLKFYKLSHTYVDQTRFIVQ